MRRREFIVGLGGAVAFPLAAHAQQPALPVVGYLTGPSGNRDGVQVRAFRQGLSEAGFTEGRNVAIEYRWADDQLERMPTLAAELVRRQVNVIALTGVPAARAAKAATSTIPIVFNIGVDPVALGLVASLSRPGGNLTGASALGGELGAKRLELIHELIPEARLIGILIDPTNPAMESQTKDMQTAAQILGVRLHFYPASSDRDFEAVFASLRELRSTALVISNSGAFISRGEQLAALALRHRIPAIFEYREFAAAGGLMSYGVRSLAEPQRLVGNYTGRILKGEKPADLPVQQSTRIELIINMTTAKALGLTFPITLLGRADEVIE
jgi:putative ABC transport system substrate-binding protein